MRITALAGGVGASKLLFGLAQAMDPASLTVIVNTGDDIVLHGLHISPDLDIVTYTLAGAVNPATGWGLEGDTFHALAEMRRYGRDAWFNLGDRDLATHIHRTALLRAGRTLTEAADSIRRGWGVASRILPMCDAPAPTMLETSEGRLHFQEYLVQRHAEPQVRQIDLAGAEKAAAPPAVLQAIREAEGIVICPSNPLISIGPILAVPGIRAALQARRDCCVAVSPIVGGKSLKGPSDKMMRELGIEVSARGVAGLYSGLAATFVMDDADQAQSPAIASLGYRVVVTRTTMSTAEDKAALARTVMSALQRKSVTAS